MNENNLQNLIFKKLDAELSEQENLELERILKASPEAMKFYNELLSIRKAVNKSSSDLSFKPLFEERVIAKLKSPQVKEYSILDFTSQLVLSFRSISIAAIIILLILITFNLTNGNHYSFETIIGNPDSGIEYAFNPLQNYFGSNL